MEIADDGDGRDFVLESCHSLWFFEPAQGRFRRFVKGLRGDLQPRTAWRRYYGVDIDPVSESFSVLLDRTGTRMLRSWVHSGSCAICGEARTEELDVEELRLAARG